MIIPSNRPTAPITCKSFYAFLKWKILHLDLSWAMLVPLTLFILFPFGISVVKPVFLGLLPFIAFFLSSQLRRSYWEYHSKICFHEEHLDYTFVGPHRVGFITNRQIQYRAIQRIIQTRRGLLLSPHAHSLHRHLEFLCRDVIYTTETLEARELLQFFKAKNPKLTITTKSVT